MAFLRKNIFGLICLAQASAWAAEPVRMDFEGLSPLVNGQRSNVAVGSFYDGGNSLSVADGSPLTKGPVPSPGVSFNAGARVTETSDGTNGGTSSAFGLTRNLLLGNAVSLLNSPALGTGVVFSGSESFVSLSAAAGFTTGVSFFFNAASDLAVSVLKQDGSALVSADFRLPSTGLCPTGQSRCEWNAASLPFDGTAYGVRFAGTVSDFALDNITLGQLDPLGALIPSDGNGGGNPGGDPGGNPGGDPGGNPGGNPGGDPGGNPGGGGGTPVEPIPEPSTYALMALGLGLVAWAGRRRKPAARA